MEDFKKDLDNLIQLAVDEEFAEAYDAFVERWSPKENKKTEAVTTILSVKSSFGNEHRCEQRVSYDETGKKIVERSEWISREGKLLDDELAMKYLEEEERRGKRDGLRIRLWGPKNELTLIKEINVTKM
jgi:hypothetical protein